MNIVSIAIPESLHEAADALARQEGVSTDHLISLALAEKISALKTGEYLEARAKRASRAKCMAVLDNIPAVTPDPEDKL